MSTQTALTDLGTQRTDAGHRIESHLVDDRVDDHHHGRCVECGRQITISPPSGIERGHNTDCEYQGRQAGGEQ
ncbi:hypothetical protein GJ631_10575 [Natronomonas sp. CBA1123]|uniref:hypothetical protein n=1 Tax=Natronomonas sp. CBA1123 TaxID=2668070 RepID=UPI0012EAF7A5|nr:hypothetical protein [Natronomonas sp. CBA1123]MUV86998.1 hypothetical protein [Natronomonas sp. CBA1123]